MKLSKNLYLSEVTYSDTAKRDGIDNTPTAWQISRLSLIAQEIFQPLRDAFNVAIYVSSGFRSLLLNKAIKGAKNSQHTRAEALDLDADKYGKITNKQIFDYIKDNLPFDQLIWEFGTDKEPAWVHVSYKSLEKNRCQILVAYKITLSNGKKITKYKPWV